MNVGLVGAGHIALALARGWSRPGLEGRPGLFLYDVRADAATAAAAECGGTAVAGLAELAEAADVLVVAVRPQHVAGVLADLGTLLGERPLVSVAAGVPVADIRAALPDGARAGRVMPNVAAALGLGVYLFVPGSLGDAEPEVAGLFALAGDVIEVGEHDFDVATAVAGCMPGMLAMLVRDFAAAGVRQGLDPETALRLAVGGVHGAAAVIARQGDPLAVIAAGATPGGMTAAAIAALEEREIAAAVDLAVEAAATRAKELA